MDVQESTVAAILIDPDARTVTQVRLPIYPADENDEDWCVNQTHLEDLYALLGCNHIDGFAMPNRHDWCYYNDEFLDDADGKQIGFFQLGADWQPVPGKCLIHGFDVAKHEYRDVTMTVEEVGTAVTWTRRIVRGYTTRDIEDGIRIERVAPIVEEG